MRSHSKELLKLNRTIGGGSLFDNQAPSYKLKIEKEKGGRLIFGVKNSNMHMIARSKELFELSRMRLESTRLDDFRQGYDDR